MFTPADARRQKWDGLHPLQFRLICAGLQCPYDLPAERDRQGREGGSSWLSSLVTSARHEPCHERDFNVLPAALHTMPVEAPGETAGNKSRLSVAPHEEKEGVTRPVAQPPAAGAIQPAGDITQREVDTSHVASEPHDPGEEGGSHKIRGEHKCPSQGAEAIPETTDADNTCAIRVPHEENKVTPTLNHRSEVLSRNDHPPATRNSCSVAVGPDEANSCNNAATVMPGHDDRTEFMASPEFHKMDALLSTAVESLYSKLQGAALKVVALDGLKQRLVEAFPSPRKSEAKEENMAELAIHLHLLKRQVKLLIDAWRGQEAARKASEERQSKAVVDAVRVEVVRAYEEPHVPYRKGPFVALAPTTQRLRSSTNKAAPTSVSGSGSTSASGSVLSSARPVESCSEFSIASAVAHADELEDEWKLDGARQQQR
ncbi:uncharacterized protein Tco025E_05911 [Trypanosoma conorhini]|uniref:Uncharacterized protein n=1 Tax=Trypanosoma conorhini TaxID=83891 RepID=A0A422P9H0_9TRYP|nr:uncharacterized protein Tco025E_05911 [Trypanosoma conorhini]RNF14353.1 hypothetical protein Tco025E_05911 [Trypanosoma conorhini]